MREGVWEDVGLESHVRCSMKGSVPAHGGGSRASYSYLSLFFSSQTHAHTYTCMRAQVPRGTAYVEVTGSLLFGAGDMLEQV